MKPTAVLVALLIACASEAGGPSASAPAVEPDGSAPVHVLRGLDGGDVVSLGPEPDAATPEPDAGADAATPEPDAGADAATPEPDAGTDAATPEPDAGTDAATPAPDAGTPGPACTGMHLAVCTGASCLTVCNVFVPGVGSGIACCNDPNYPNSTYWCDCP